MFSLLDKEHKNDIFILDRSSRIHWSNTTSSDVALSMDFASCNSEFIEIKLSDFEDSCPLCFEKLSNRMNVTLSCCQARYCFNCYIGQIKSSLECPTIRDPTSQTELLAHATFIIAQQIVCCYCRTPIDCVYLTNLSEN